MIFATTSYFVCIFKYFLQQYIQLRIIYLILTTKLFVAKNWVIPENYFKGWGSLFFLWQRLFSNNNGFFNNLYFLQRKEYSGC